MNKEKVEYLLKETYLAVILGSPGTTMFRDCFANVNGEKKSITKGGVASCGFHVSNILCMFNLIKEPHATVTGTIADMKKSGWIKIDRPKVGSVIIWEPKEINGNANEHCGFYIGKQMAISNNPKFKKLAKHHWTYGGTVEQPSRKVTAIYWHSKLD